MHRFHSEGVFAPLTACRVCRFLRREPHEVWESREIGSTSESGFASRQAARCCMLGANGLNGGHVARLSWLHFSDLQLGTRGSRLLQPEYRDALEKDLRKLHALTGPWDLVLISGDLTKTGSEREFELVNSTLGSLWKFFNSLGSTPCLLTVPGNHDILQGSATSKLNHLRALDVRNAHHDSGTSVQEQEVRAGLAPFSAWFSAWRKEHPVPLIQSFHPGLLPGDFVTTLRKERLKIGVVGLNSLFRSSPDDALESRHEIHLQQLDAATRDDVRRWAREHDILLLLTHHAPRKLHTQSLELLLSALTPPAGAVLHLCGGRHEMDMPAIQKTTEGVLLHAPSLFGWDDASKHSWGYIAGNIDMNMSEMSGQLSLFSRVTAHTRVGLEMQQDKQLHPLNEGPVSIDFSPSGLSLPKSQGSLASPGRDTDQGPSSLLRTLGDGIQPAPEELTAFKPESFTQDAAHDDNILAVVNQRQASILPRGVKLRETLFTGRAAVGWMAWAPAGDLLAVGLSDGRLMSWYPSHGSPRWVIQAHETAVTDLCFEPSGQRIASCSGSQLRLWNAKGKQLLEVPLLALQSTVAWSSSGLLAASTFDGRIIFWWADSGSEEVRSVPRGSPSEIYCMAWSTNGQRLACGGEGDGTLLLWDIRTDDSLDISYELHRAGNKGAIQDIAWKPGSPLLALACRDKSIRIWNTKTQKLVGMLEGHTDVVVSVSFSCDGQLLASKSLDGTVCLFRTDTWKEVAKLDEPPSALAWAGLTFSASKPLLATLSPGSRGVRIWDIDVEALLTAQTPASTTVHNASAKVVLVGEGRAGKSCLALRMVKGAYEELGSTHGIRFWSMPVEATEQGRRIQREVILWDMGGQSEYQLVHQLFLSDSTVALMVMEPGRGKPALDEIEGWNQRLLAQTRAHPVRKLLIGAKMDDENAPVDEGAIDHFIQRLQFSGYVSTSARTGRGLPELKNVLASTIEWDAIEKVSRPELFQRLREHIQRLRNAKKVVITFTDLEDELRRDTGGAVDSKALQAVVAQLAWQGLLADTRLADGTQALVLEVEQVERYAGSLVLAARDNPHGVPAIDVAKVRSRNMLFPRIRPEERLRWDQELIVLDCVTQLLLEHGLCLQHEGLLIFPSLFRPTQHGPAADFPYSVSMHYDFTGPVDNIYASLVSSLAISRGFGSMRLWEDRAEFGRAGEATAGVRRVQHGSQGARGFARLDLFFDTETPKDKRDLFVNFVEEHLAEHGVELLERLSVTCACGRVFVEDIVLARIESGQADIGCQVCDRRTPLTLGAQASRAQDPGLANKTRALRTQVREQRSQTISETKVIMAEAEKTAPAQDTPLRILHLSDLHVGAKEDPLNLFQPLVADLKDKTEGLGLSRLDYLVISGDITNRATPEEFEQARKFVSELIQEFGLTSERCIIVPGNHDLHWDTEVYSLKKKRQVNEKELKLGMYHQEGDVFFIREETKYAERFRNFSQHFYHPLLQKEYPLSAEQQCLPFLFPETRLQFLSMNSAWEIDEYFKERSSISEHALSRGLAEADSQLADARKAGTLAAGAKVLRLGVWHHPITGNEKIQSDAFMGRLQQADVRICMHGHVHEDRADLVGYLNPTRRIHVMGAGSFGAPTAERPESVPRLYNLLEVNRDLGGFRVNTRSMPRQGGAWRGHAIWRGPERAVMRTFYDVSLI
ncbi:hypothetical protein FJV41_46130 [Myxococcus llanfairpwllgwyngyllgogerychwyrndrobwllllantysiliogogogochensis]|uniref:Calcineurin-like phosphoesterase domain-containing protein n=1 Tax=Myxococcus llanfairpwllgwyngyllgogerychwyrndrobwllllantysiliogogogochensis TaxID=2590453 RepID=A0A540WJF2_9BACT|nr:metallophosphoesterase [Myxococcus llanfairpwllgwyngyllgogerychwyrndrobwllllantysiliogogogochensis]TQF09152.1 hypothetical protein FJV41_46130 [Myxococcus llanfairpwllgwyngyllgogerychwyrndrobwllllantysiliogogogochensis]